LNKENFGKTLKGSVPWMAPEVIKQINYGKKADIWSFGCTLIEMVTAKSPWSQYNFDNPITAIMKIGLSEEIPFIPESISENLNALILACLKRNPDERPITEDLIK